MKSCMFHTVRYFLIVMRNFRCKKSGKCLGIFPLRILIFTRFARISVECRSDVFIVNLEQISHIAHVDAEHVNAEWFTVYSIPKKT